MIDAYRLSAAANLERNFGGTQIRNGSDAGSKHQWPDPEPIDADEGTPAAFPLDALPAMMERAARDIANGTKCPPALAAASVLAVASFSIQNHFDVEFAQRQRRPLSLCILTVAASGERKSTVDRYAARGVHEYRTQLALEHAAREKDIAEAKKAKSDYIPDPLPDPNIVIGNMTLQGIFRAFAEGQTSLALFSDEGGEFLGGHSMKAENRLGSLAELSKFWDGGLQAYKLRGTKDKSETLTANDCRLAVHLQAQPVALQPFLADPIAKGQGLLARCLIHQPASTIGTRIMTLEEWQADGMTIEVQSFAMLVKALLGRPVNRDDGAVQRELLPLTTEAMRALVDYANEVERSLAPAGDLEGMSDLVNKVQEQAARIAGTFAAFTDQTEVSGPTMEGAIRVARYFLSETVRLARIGPQNAAAKDALTVAVWLHERKGVVPCKTFSRCGPKHLRKVINRQEAFSLLKDANWIREANGMLELNPKCAALGMIQSPVAGERGEQGEQ
ncbi:DUF3987 domain-containing protein [Hyphomonas sp.]|uniref:DUF3987 domain-containing protein n=1 Tax=Hyphomonas sp. TaxID=87 RepID=UPI0025B7B06C|nr:DUF3987 domain-containing protein [Hyphomonas sp.]